MKYDAHTVINDLDGNPIKEPDGSNGTLAIALKRAILSDVDENGQPLRGDDKIKRYEVFHKVYGLDTIELNAEEVALLSKAVLIFPTIIAGQVRDILSQKVRKESSD